MICRSTVPNCGNVSIYPSPFKTRLPFLPAAWRTRLPTFPPGLSASCSAIGDGGVVGELPATGSFYELLGIPASGSHDEIKRAYKQLARKYHPDVSPPDRTEEYTQRFIEVQEAYETLSDPGRRAVYDRCLGRGLHLAFSTSRQFDEELERKSGWKDNWQDQLSELKWRSMSKNSDDSLSWGARMRRRREESAGDL